MATAVVYHTNYGCDTGCCGHVLELGDREGWTFDHPRRGVDDFREWALNVLREEFGADHVADLDWENCRVSDD